MVTPWGWHCFLAFRETQPHLTSGTKAEHGTGSWFTSFTAMSSLNPLTDVLKIANTGQRTVTGTRSLAYKREYLPFFIHLIFYCKLVKHPILRP